MYKKIPRICVLFFLFSYCYATLAAEYVDNQTCLNCHQNIANKWKKSDHYFSMQLPTDKTVLGDFDNVNYQDEHRKVSFTKHDGKYIVTVSDKNEQAKTYTVKYTFGYRPLQQYLLEFPEGKLQAFDIAWDSKKNQWFGLDDANSSQIGSPRHWRKRFYNWNYACADCHSTQFKKNYTGSRYNSHFSGINVNCQACHGPGSEHLKWTKEKKTANKGFVVDYGTMKPREVVESCAHCHSRRAQVSSSYQHTKSFKEMYIPALLRNDLYYPDGQIKDEVFVYGSFIQSKMYHAGVSCNNCHDPHDLTLKLPGNAVCTQCHNSASKKQFPGLKIKNYAIEAHSHHKQSSAGSDCVSCHMPATTYMKIDPRRDHSFKIPNPELTIKYGIPNACNRCHTKKSPQWAKEQMEKWYGQVTQNSLLLIADQNRLVDIINDKNSPEIFVASALMLITVDDENAVNLLVSKLNDADIMIRHAAVQRFSQLPSAVRLRYLPLMLEDDNIIIRASVASALADTAANKLPSFIAAINDYLTLQKANLDTAASHTNLAQLALKLGKINYVTAGLKKAISIDKHFVPAYILLSQYYINLGELDNSIKILKLGLVSNSNNANLHYTLGLAYIGLKKYQLARKHLNKALTLVPNWGNAVYHLSQVLLKLKQDTHALKLLLSYFDAHNEASILPVIIQIYNSRGDIINSKKFQNKLLSIEQKKGRPQ